MDLERWATMAAISFASAASACAFRFEGLGPALPGLIYLLFFLVRPVVRRRHARPLAQLRARSAPR